MKRSQKKSKKRSLANRKLTIIKILPKNGTISQADLDRWHEVFRNHLMSDKDAVATGEVEVEYIPVPKAHEHFVTLVRVGNDEYHPTTEDLEQWRQVFEDAAKDPDFKIFTHNAINIEVLNVNDIIAVES